ncbi:cinnamoyl-CoA reductase 1 [Dorcoceras hygrometricum]|uniref:Cinnamoyl-CoA reductase 1 n=1 Tax=Dorcoceras hygrometricum TaxID=472368 RepID=A0A2Z7B586_9LAMI|nr:cinnamoyl-CoA reductase 1 [Dorcoceras hygrometricum]
MHNTSSGKTFVKTAQTGALPSVLTISWKKIAKEAALCSLLAFEQICFCRSGYHDFYAGRGVDPAGNASEGRQSVQVRVLVLIHTKSATIVLTLYVKCAACLVWSRHEDIQTVTVMERLSWNDRRYLAGTIVTLLASRRLAPTIFHGENLALVGIQLAVGPQPLWLRNHNFGLAQWIMVKRLAISCHDPLGITDSAYKNQLVVVSVMYGPFNTYIPIRSTTIGKSRVARDPISMRTSWRSNSDIASVTRSTTIGKSRVARDPIAMHTSWRSNSDIASVTRVSMTFRVVRTNQYNQDLGHIHSTNGNHLESPNEGSSIDHQVTIHLHAQNITMFPTNETWYFASQMLVSSSGGLILILTAQSTRNEFRIHSDY